MARQELARQIEWCLVVKDSVRPPVRDCARASMRSVACRPATSAPAVSPTATPLRDCCDSPPALLEITARAFDPGKVNQDRFVPAADRLLVAQLTGTARHHARWRDLTADEQAAAVTELRELAAGRADLLAQVAGIFEGASAGRHDEPLARQAATLSGSPEPTTPSSRPGPPKDAAGPGPPASRRTAAGPSNRMRRISTAAAQPGMSDAPPGNGYCTDTTPTPLTC